MHSCTGPLDFLPRVFFFRKYYEGSGHMKKFVLSIILYLMAFCVFAQQNQYRNKKYDSLEKKKDYRAIISDIQDKHAVVYSTSDYYYLGVAYFHLENDAEAQKYLNLAIEKDPNFMEAYDYLGGSHYFDGNYDEAIKNFKKCIELNPKYPQPYEMLGEIYESYENYEQALHFYLEYRKLKNTSEVNQRIACIYYKLNATGKAVPYLKEYLKHDKNSFSMTNMMVMALYCEGNYKEASKYEKKLTKIWNSTKDVSIKKQNFYKIHSFYYNECSVDICKSFLNKGNANSTLTCNIKKDGVVVGIVTLEYDSLSNKTGGPSYFIGIDDLSEGIHYTTAIGFRNQPDFDELINVIKKILDGKIEMISPNGGR